MASEQQFIEANVEGIGTLRFPAGTPMHVIQSRVKELTGMEESVRAALPWEESKLAKYRHQQKSLGVDDPNQSASFWTTLKASLHPSVEKQIQQYAQDRGIEIERYGVDREGNVVYLNDQNQVVREIPSVAGAAGVVDLFRRLGQFFGSQAGPSIPQVAAGTTGLVMGPTGASIPAAAGVAGVVDLGRQALGNLLIDQPVMDLDYQNAAGQALLGATGQATTVGLNKLLTSNPLKVGRQDVTNLRDPLQLQRYIDDQNLAASLGVTVTPAEATGARSLLARQRQLGRFPESSTTMGDFYERRAGQELPGAVDRLRARIADLPPEAGAESLRKGASDIMTDLTRQRTAATRQKYAFVDDPANMVPEDQFAPIANDPYLKTVLASVKQDPLYGFSALPDNALPVIDAAKKKIDDQIEIAKRAGEKNRVRLLEQKRDALVDAADTAFPQYAEARGAFAAASQPVNEAEQSLVSLISGDERIGGIQVIPARMFGRTSSNPTAVTKARKIYEDAGKLDQWNAGLSAYIGNAWESVAKQNAPASSFYRALKADPKQEKILKAAMSNDQWEAFDGLMRVMDMVRRAPVEGSPTATDLGGRSAFVGPGGRVVKTVAGAMSPQNIGQNIANFAADVSAGRNAEKIAALITNPGSVAELKKLRMLNPASEKALTIVDHVLTNVIGGQVTPRPAAMEPPALLSAP